MKKLVLSILAIFIIGLFVACNQDVTVDAQIHDATHGHTDITYFSIQSDGSWKCKYCDYILPGTESPYITVLNDGYPTEIIPLTSTTDVGYGTVTIEGDSVTYSNASGNGQDVVIRTESLSTTVTINSPDDVVKHYGTAGSLNIIAVKSTSYHEFGKVAFAEIKTGRMVLEEESKVTHIHLTVTDTGADAHFNDITVAKAGSVTMPAFSRDPVDIPEGGRLVVALQDGIETTDEKDYVWLTAVGIYEQVTVSDSKTEAGNSFAADSSNQEKKDTAAQIANNISFSEGDDNYKVTAKTTDGGNTWTYEVVDQNGTVSEGYSATKDSTENTVNVQTTGASPTDVETTKENGMTSEEKEAVQEEVVETAKNNEEIEEAEDAGYEITHHDALAPTCTAEGHTAYDSYFDNNEEIKIGYKVIPATGHHKSDNPSYQHAFSAAHWQHATQCAVDSAWIVEDCIDLNNDNYCDICNQQMYVLVYTSSDLHTNSNYSTAIWNGAYKLMNNVSLDTMSRIYGDVVIDLNGYTLSNYSINSPADTQFMSYSNANATYTLTLRDSSISKTGMFMSRFGDTFFDGSGNSGNNRFILNCEDGVTINTSFDYQGIEMASFAYSGGYFINNASKNIIIRNAHLVIGGIARVNSGYTVTFKDCVIESRQNSTDWQSGSGSIVYDGCTITTVKNSTNGNVLDSSSPNVSYSNGTIVNGVEKQ